MCMNKGCLGVALGSDGGSTMHDIDRLRKEANRLRALAKQAKEHGKSEHADRLQVRAQHCLDDAAVLDMVEMRLRAEQAKPRRVG
jgi:5-enolpyruvylshikimate-3-phosphate synthase